jgi:excisionase family DNA binding protein
MAPSGLADTWLTADQAAEYLGLSSRKALYERVRRGQLPAHRFGRSLRFRAKELDAAIINRAQPIADTVDSLLRRSSAQKKGGS